jgi:hypothetical protein
MLALLASLAILGTAQEPSNLDFTTVGISSESSAYPHLSYSVRNQRLDPPRYSPKKFGTDDPQPYEFDWVIAAMAKYTEGLQPVLRFRVYSQEKKSEGDRAPVVTRMLLQLWKLAQTRYRFDNPSLYHEGVIDVFLCWGGDPGGEQRFDVYTEGHFTYKVNTIYIYDLASFTNPVEMAREVAHEYGHAILPPVGGFQTPEDWGNGQLGEKLFLRQMRDRLAAGSLETDDMMGASLKGLDAWVAHEVDPLVLQNASQGPAFGLLEGHGQGAMDAYTGLVCYADAILPADVVAKSMMIIGSTNAKDYPAALLAACQAKERVVIGIPTLLKGKNLWVPLGDGKAVGARVLKKNGDWALISPGLAAVTLVYGS